ncbi:unnamed protein product [Rotaria sordida]|uniref:Medium-chain acyl-CoA ligase ACSF2, mitochondrial n=1 Tax=Rotaria sordida TaxID=392033 RepID=A0A814VBD1_9BILA|nr:unnamed protein product [Rotaria sordida]CAF1186698.1 unnamed protein product [Rotaria sordida]
MSFVASKLGLIKVNINPGYVERELEYCINKVGCKASANPDLPVAIFYTLGTTGHSKAATLTHFGIVNMSKGVTEHLEPYFTRLCTPIPIFHIFAEVVGVLNVATSKCQIVFPAIIT